MLDYLNAGSLKELVNYVGGLTEEVLKDISKSVVEGIMILHSKFKLSHQGLTSKEVLFN